MIPANNASGNSSGAVDREFTDAFIRLAHRTLYEGYVRLDAIAYRVSEEDEITGDLAEAMMDFLGECPEPWARYYQVQDQRPVNMPGGPVAKRRVGKRRSKIDLHLIASGSSGGFSHFSWEAKRLGPGHAFGAYFGGEGLGCFLSGQYAVDSDFGGMLGYVQSEDLGARVAYLHKRLGKDLKRVIASLVTNVASCSEARHQRPSLGREITIYHTLLHFC